MADLDEAALLTLAEQVGADISGAAFRDFQKAAPHLAAAAHALGLSWAARVAERSMLVALDGNQEGTEAFLRLLATLRERADTTIAIAQLHETTKGEHSRG